MVGRRNVFFYIFRRGLEYHQRSRKRNETVLEIRVVCTSKSW